MEEGLPPLLGSIYLGPLIFQFLMIISAHAQPLHAYAHLANLVICCCYHSTYTLYSLYILYCHAPPGFPFHDYVTVRGASTFQDVERF
jgi:hypothetical protein